MAPLGFGNTKSGEATLQFHPYGPTGDTPQHLAKMSEAKPASTKKDKKKKVEENGEIVSESSEHSVATDSEPKKSSKSKKNQNGASSEDVSVESESVSEESSKKKKKKSSSSSVAATEASTEGNAAEGEADELEPIGPKHGTCIEMKGADQLGAITSCFFCVLFLRSNSCFRLLCRS